MGDKIGIGLIGFVLGIGVGYLSFAVPTDESPDVMSMEHDMGMSAHAMLEVDKNSLVPSVTVEVFPDVKGGYNLHLKTENFKFTPEKVNKEPVQGEGHAHVYVNGTKVSRLYGDWYNLPASSLNDGDNVVEVTLNANDHSEWTSGENHISNIVTVTK
ncbi:MAG: hypothetical protein LR008_00155 [Candidatus Pacebacteria bacterium]|nr:hypothetical protein [Candidatus Paceibacterota bacterium]